MRHRLKIGATCAVGAPKNAPFPLRTEDLYATAGWLAGNGFDSMEVHIRAPEMVDGPRFAAHCRGLGLEISTIGTGMAYGMEGLSLSSPDEAVRRAAVRRLMGQLDLGAELGCPVIIGSMRGRVEDGDTWEQADRRMVASMQALADYAEKTDTRLVIEAINRFETNYLRTAEEVLALLERVGSRRVLVHLDTYHMNLEEQDWRAPILRCGRALGHVHVADNSRRYPGWGLVDFRAVITALLEIGYAGSLTMECDAWPDGETAVLRGRAHLRAVMEAYCRK